jgi:hypothetical protein
MHVQVSLNIEIGASASIAEMERRMQAAGQQGMREALKQAIRKREDQNASCPDSGEKQCRREGPVRRTIATAFGRVEVARRRFRCQACLHRWCPANGLLVELKGGTISQPLQEAARLSGCSWPYRGASQLLKKLSGAHISARSDPSAHQAARQVTGGTAGAAAVPAAENAQPPRLLGVGGGWVCSRDQRRHGGQGGRGLF